MMRISEMNWKQVEAYLQSDDRAVLPLGSTEQHAYLSLSTDSILSERVAVAAAEPLGIPVFPVLAYGITPAFRAYPGTISLRVSTYMQVIKDVLDGLKGMGFRRILIVNGHGGNVPAQGLVGEWLADNPGALRTATSCGAKLAQSSEVAVRVQFHNWWNAPRTWAKVMEIDPVASHASWMENFPWTRLPGVESPAEQKPMIDFAKLRMSDPQAIRELLGDGNYGGLYTRSDAEMQAIWDVAIEETRALLTGPWA